VHEASVASALILSCFAIEAVAFFGGFSLFSALLTLLHLTCHTIGGILLALVVLTKAHYQWAWYIFAFFSAVPAAADLCAVISMCIHRDKRW